MADRAWQPDGPHRWTLQMGPVEIRVILLDWWIFDAHLRVNGYPPVEVARDDYEPSDSKPPPSLAQCQADAIAAVEAWRDSIR